MPEEGNRDGTGREMTTRVYSFFLDDLLYSALEIYDNVMQQDYSPVMV